MLVWLRSAGLLILLTFHGEYQRLVLQLSIHVLGVISHCDSYDSLLNTCVRVRFPRCSRNYDPG